MADLPMKQLEYSYEQVKQLRELLIDEMAENVHILTVEHLKLVEMRLQTVLMLGIGMDNLRKEVKKQRT